MGLDMYLYRETFVKNWNHTPAKNKHKVTVLRGGKPRKDIDPDKIATVSEEVAYWRKANAIHRWFVKKCYGGSYDEYDGGRLYVSREDLENLRRTIIKVVAHSKLVDGKIYNGITYKADGTVEEEYVDGKIIENPELAQQLLPTQDGFFFGPTDYDQYYIDDLVYTKNKLDEILDYHEADNYSIDQDYYYEASW